jgi:hypothetical protein
MSDLINPTGPWSPGRDPFTLSETKNGRSNPGWGTISTQDQALSGMLNMTGYRLVSDAKKSDFYSVFGSFTHGVRHAGDYDPARNWASVGYYATKMILGLECLSDHGMLWDAGPTSTVGAATTSFNIGGNISGGVFAGEPIVTGGISTGFGASFSSPDVVIAASQQPSGVRWDIDLPGVGFISPAVPPNPKPPSYAGYTMYFGAIFVVPKGTPFKACVAPRIDWEFDWTRGISNDVKHWQPDTSPTGPTIYSYSLEESVKKG